LILLLSAIRLAVYVILIIIVVVGLGMLSVVVVCRRLCMFSLLVRSSVGGCVFYSLFSSVIYCSILLVVVLVVALMVVGLCSMYFIGFGVVFIWVCTRLLCRCRLILWGRMMWLVSVGTSSWCASSYLIGVWLLGFVGWLVREKVPIGGFYLSCLRMLLTLVGVLASSVSSFVQCC